MQRGGWKIPTSKIPFIAEGSSVPADTPESAINGESGDEDIEPQSEAPPRGEPTEETASAGSTLPDGVKEIDNDDALDGAPSLDGAFDYDLFEVRRGFAPDEGEPPPGSPEPQRESTTNQCYARRRTAHRDTTITIKANHSHPLIPLAR